MHNLCARLVLWLIRPALERRAAECSDLQAAVLQTVLDDLRKNGRVARAMRGMLNPDCSVALPNRGGWPSTHAQPVPRSVVPAKPGGEIQIGPLDV